MNNRIRACALSLALALAACQSAPDGSPERQSSEWPSYAADKASAKYSPLDQIDRTNVADVEIAWSWRSIDAAVQEQSPDLKAWLFEATPIFVNDKLYTSTGFSQVAAIDPTSGETIWSHDPKTYEGGRPSVYGFTHRGVAYWQDRESPDDKRILIGTGDGYLLALDAETGDAIRDFGDNGRVDLFAGLGEHSSRGRFTVSSPPVICRDVVVVGSALGDAVGPNDDLPAGDVRGYDARTGERLWTFHSGPRDGEFGADSWADGSREKPRGVSVWPPMSADDDLGYVYLPFSTAASDYYGGARHGDNLFAESVVCLRAETGERVWHFQTTHHGLWDYDPPAAPILADINVEGRAVKALAQVTKQAFCFVLDRETGEPVWPIEEREVPASDAPGEKAAATQPFPTKPAAFDRQGSETDDDLIDFTPKLREEAAAILNEYKRGPLYTPPSFGGTITLPGAHGGASWAGAAFDPETGMLFVPSITKPGVMTLYGPGDPRLTARGGGMPTFDPYFGFRGFLQGPEGLPLHKPPYGRITAIDLNTGEHVWVAPSGNGPVDHPLLKNLDLPHLGWPLRTFVIATKSLLISSQEGPVSQESFARQLPTQTEHLVQDAMLRAYDKASGKLLAEVEMPRNASGSPMTYMADGKQYIVVATGGSNLPAELVAFALR